MLKKCFRAPIFNTAHRIANYVCLSQNLKELRRAKVKDLEKTSNGWVNCKLQMFLRNPKNENGWGTFIGNHHLSHDMPSQKRSQGGTFNEISAGHLHVFGRLRPEMVRGAGCAKNLRQYRILSSNVPLAYAFARRHGVIRRVRTFMTFRYVHIILPPPLSGGR